MKIFIREKAFYGRLAAIAIPIALQNLITFSVSMADTVMIGMLGETHLSAASLANQVGFVFTLFCFGVAGGSNVLIAQFWGKQDVGSIHRVLALMYRVMLTGGVLFTVAAIFFSRQIMHIFSTDPLVIEYGSRFMRILGRSFLLLGISNTTVIMLRSVGSVRVSLVVYLSSLATNVFLNWVLIFGNLGAPRLEIEGAAIATCMARAVEVVIVLVYMIRFEKKIVFRLRHLFMRTAGMLREFVRTSLPVVFNELIWSTGMAMIAVIIGRMGTDFTAANSICSVLSQLVTITIFGVGHAAAAIIGNTVGEGDYERAKAYGRTLMAISVLLGLASSGVVMLLRGPMISLYNVSETVQIYAAQIISIYAIVIIFQSFSAISLIGVLRGGGDSRFVLMMDVLFMWMVSIPVGFAAGLGFGLPVAAVYAIIKSDDLFKCIFAFYRVTKGKWIKDVTLSGR